MTIPKLSDIVGIINKIAPQTLAETWDAVGLQVGDPAASVTRIMTALDPGEPAVDAAIAAGCQLLVTHHPFIFKPLPRLSAADPVTARIFRAIRNNLAVVSLHTNYDTAEGGLNDLLAQRIGVTSCTPLTESVREELVKLAVFVPKGFEEQVMTALFRFTAGLGNYRDCSFRVDGTGTFLPLEGAKPFRGEVGIRESVQEARLEVLLRAADLGKATEALKAAHPYEEPAYDLYPLLNRGQGFGLGRIGVLESPATLAAYAADVRERLGCCSVRYVGNPVQTVRRVALCSGSGASFLHEAKRRGADLLVTGDVKYHEARTAEEIGLALMDAGHFGTEIIAAQGLATRISSECRHRRYEVELLCCHDESDPFQIVTSAS
jgi:dinuclear metal center YbgI/SA1388 family protein